MRNWIIFGILALISSFFIYQNCGKDFSISRRANFAVNFACDPFGSAEAIDGSSGLIADVYDANGQEFSSVNEYLSRGVRSDTAIFFANINVPTFEFNRGFRKSDGSFLKDRNGNMLVEWFALHYKTVVTLPSGYQPGNYEFAIISDDGSRVSINLNNQVTEIINNDGLQSTKVGCSRGTINMSQGSLVPMEIKYFQGPRYDIANVLVWRRVPNGGPAGQDPLCGFMHRTEIFDYTNGSIPVRFNEMLSRGWQVVPPQAFRLPSGINNPCVR